MCTSRQPWRSTHAPILPFTLASPSLESCFPQYFFTFSGSWQNSTSMSLFCSWGWLHSIESPPISNEVGKWMPATSTGEHQVRQAWGLAMDRCRGIGPGNGRWLWEGGRLSWALTRSILRWELTAETEHESGSMRICLHQRSRTMSDCAALIYFAYKSARMSFLAQSTSTSPAFIVIFPLIISLSLGFPLQTTVTVYPIAPGSVLVCLILCALSSPFTELILP